MRATAAVPRVLVSGSPGRLGTAGGRRGTSRVISVCAGQSPSPRMSVRTLIKPNQAGAGDPHRLDADNNGIACESNPRPCIGRGNPGGQKPGTDN